MCGEIEGRVMALIDKIMKAEISLECKVELVSRLIPGLKN
jgi:hypothetical protein